MNKALQILLLTPGIVALIVVVAFVMITAPVVFFISLSSGNYAMAVPVLVMWGAFWLIAYASWEER